MKKIVLGFAIGALAVTSAFAAHNNPWAGPEDTVQSKNHDANQEQSSNTPGEDEMSGEMNHNAGSKAGGGFGGSAPAKGSGHQGGGGAGGGSR